MSPEKNSEKIIIPIEGVIDIFNAQNLKNELADALENGKETLKEIHLDMSKLQHIDSAGVGVLVFFCKHIKELNIRLILKNVPENVRYTFKLGFFEKYFEFED